MRRASGLRCSACGAPLPPEAARCPGCGLQQGTPFLLGDQEERAANRVTMPSRSRRRLVLVVAAVLGLVGALAVVDGRRSTAPAAKPALPPTTSSPPVTRAPTTSTSTTSPIPRQIVGELTGIELLVTSRAGATSIDLDTGTVRAEPVVTNGNIIPVQGGVILGGQGSLAYFAAPFSGQPRVLALFRNSTVVPSAYTDRVWVVTSDPTTTAQEVGLDGTVIVPPFELPLGTYAAGAVDGGLLLGLHGSMFVTHDAGELRALGPGQPVAASARTVAAVVCDADASCPLTLIDVVSGRRRSVALSDSNGADVNAAFSPDGRHLAVITSTPSGRWLGIVDVETGLTHRHDPDAAGVSSLAWSRSGEWVFWTAGRSVLATRSDGAAWVEVWRSTAPLDSVYALEAA